MQAEARIIELEMMAPAPQDVDSDAELKSMLMQSAARSHPESSQLESGVHSNDTLESHETLIRLLETLHEAELRRAQAEDAAAQAVADKESAIRSAEMASHAADKQRVLLVSLQHEVSEMQKTANFTVADFPSCCQAVCFGFCHFSNIARQRRQTSPFEFRVEAVETRMLSRKGELDGVLRELQQADSRRSDIVNQTQPEQNHKKSLVCRAHPLDIITLRMMPARMPPRCCS